MIINENKKNKRQRSTTHCRLFWRKPKLKRPPRQNSVSVGVRCNKIKKQGFNHLKRIDKRFIQLGTY